jgi:DNA repair exonuclease SbcCD nuclease subunit
MRFIHTADWQIGKPFRQFRDRESVLRQARLAAVERIGELAMREDVAHVLVAGDVYDSEQPSPRTLLEPLERMRQFPRVAWHLIPGNHDPHRPRGLWDRLHAHGLPANVHAHLTPAPVPLGEEAVLLPAPLTRKSETGDLTRWMDGAESPPGVPRIGLAHGAVAGFGTEGEAGNPVDPGRAERAALAYLALGDWHRTARISARVWYAGTPEPDRAGGQERGTALLVDIPGPLAAPAVTPLETGRYRWLTVEEHIARADDIEALDARVRGLGGLSALVLRLRLSGAVSLADRAALDARLLALSAALFHLDADMTKLVARPTDQDLESIDFGGVLRHAADLLRALARDETRPPDERRQAEDALVELYTRVAGDGGPQVTGDGAA